MTVVINRMSKARPAPDLKTQLRESYKVLGTKPFTRGGETAVKLMLNHGYFMGLYYTMQFFEVKADDPIVRTLATNGVSCWVNPEFWDQLNRDQRVTAVAHEIGHKMLLHSTRRGHRDRYVWNIAGDHVINLMLKDSQFRPLENMTIRGKPWEWWCDARFRNMTTEAVYDVLIKEYEDKEEEQRKGGGQPGGDQPGTGEPDDGNPIAKRDLDDKQDVVEFGKDPVGDEDDADGGGKGKETAQDFEDRVRQEVKDMERAAQQAGKVPAWMKGVIENVDHLKVPWHEVLIQYVKSLVKSEYSYNRWNKRSFVMRGTIDPDRVNPALGRVRCYIDSSGSCWHAINTFNKHMRDIWTEMQPEAVEVRYFQTQVMHEFDQCFERGDGDVVEIQKEGGGGTSFTWLADETEQEAHDVDLILFLTDMEGEFGREVDGVPVLWLSVSHISTAPFGDGVINIE
jgi:predicted metal-dependent peptidase